MTIVSRQRRWHPWCVRWLVFCAIVAGSVAPRVAEGQIPAAPRKLGGPPVIDGRLNADEWPLKGAFSQKFGYGWMLARTDPGSLYLAFDVLADSIDDGFWNGTAGDLLQVYVDVDGDGVLNMRDLTYGPAAGSASATQLIGGALVKIGRPLTTQARIAMGFGVTERGRTPHRVWELAIPISELLGQKAAAIGIAARVSSTQPAIIEFGPQARSLMTIAVVPGNPTTLRLPASPAPAVENSVAPAGDPGGMTGRRILPDGGVEVTFADGTKKIYRGGSTETIFPDGRRQTISAMTVARPSPPALPSDPPVQTWIEAEAADLLETISRLVGGNQESINNYLASEQGLSLYQKVDKRIRCIFYLIAPR